MLQTRLLCLCGAAEKKHTFQISPLANVRCLFSPTAQDTKHQPGPWSSSMHSVKEAFGECPKRMSAAREKESEPRVTAYLCFCSFPDAENLWDYVS